jgi:hypothetical protein
MSNTVIRYAKFSLLTFIGLTGAVKVSNGVVVDADIGEPLAAQRKMQRR